MCVVLLPVACVPSWHEAQVPLTCVWSTRAVGAQAPTVWQASQALLVCRCEGPLAVAVPPGVWHEAQSPETLPWSNFDGLQAAVPWHALHSMVVAMWPAGLPGTWALLWQDEHVPWVCSWSKRVAGDHAEVVWHASHCSVLRMWPEFFGVAPMREPCEWQAAHARGVPWNTASTWHDSQACSRCAPVSS